MTSPETLELVGILQVIWRRRFLVGVGALLAIAAGTLATYRVSALPPAMQSRATTLGYAQEYVLVDTPLSSVAAVQASDTSTIAVRSLLLGELLGSNEARAIMAREAGLRPAEIGVVGPGTGVPGVATPLAEMASEVAQPRKPNMVFVREGPSLPMLSILARGPTSQRAGRLARAAAEAASVLGGRETTVGGVVKVERLGQGETWSKMSGPGKMRGVFAAVSIFVAWCIAIIALDGVFRRRHRPSLSAHGQGVHA